MLKKKVKIYAIENKKIIDALVKIDARGDEKLKTFFTWPWILLLIQKKLRGCCIRRPIALYTYSSCYAG